MGSYQYSSVLSIAWFSNRLFHFQSFCFFQFSLSFTGLLSISSFPNKHSASIPSFLPSLYVHLQLSTSVRSSLLPSTSHPSLAPTQLISLQSLEMIRAERRLIPELAAAVCSSLLRSSLTLNDQNPHLVQRKRLQRQVLQFL